jgi:ComEC/Rec2-related protein
VTAPLLDRRRPHLLAAALCSGFAGANVVRGGSPAVALVAAVALPFAVWADAATRLALVALLLALGGWWWGSARLERLDRSALRHEVGRADDALVETTAPARRGRFEVRVLARVLRFGRLRIHESVLLELPAGRAPPQGARLAVLGRLALPRGPVHGFDERTWLRRQGIHAVLRGDRWHAVGRRDGLGGFADRLHLWLGRSAALGLRGEQRGVVEGVVLGEDQGLSDDLRNRFRASGLYHLLAVSGQNVALVAGGALALAWLLGLSRLVGEAAALAAILAYALAVGPQPSVVRATVAGVVASLAWLTARQRDRWYALLLGAIALLAWNPYLALDAGFQLSFAAVWSIFAVAPCLARALEGFPLPSMAREVLAVSTACSLATAPVSWFQFHRISLLAVPANAAAAPVVAPLLWLAFVTAGLAHLAPGVAVVVAQLNGWCAAYLAGCARLVGGLPFAQVSSTRGALGVCAVALLVAAYAWRRDKRAEVGLPPHRRRPSEDRESARPPAEPVR